MIEHALWYAGAFAVIWFGSGLAIKSVQRLAEGWRLSSFSVSFLILGVFTSVSETAVGINAIIDNDPEIFVGNLIGATIVIFLMIVPILAIVGNKIRISAELGRHNLLMSLAVIGLPVFLSSDRIIDRFDALILVVGYGILALSMENRRGLKEKLKLLKAGKQKTVREIAKIIGGVGMVFAASRIVVDQTMYFSQTLGMSPFMISLLVIAVGTNIPELSLAVRSFFLKDNQVAFGDYVGSAAFNTFLVGALTLAYGKPVQLTNNYWTSLAFLASGLGLFYVFAKTKNSISRLEGWGLLAVYAAFLVVEVFWVN